jgi:hypothetical protein
LKTQGLASTVNRIRNQAIRCRLNDNRELGRNKRSHGTTFRWVLPEDNPQ